LSGAEHHFECTPGGSVAAGRRRLRRLLAGVALAALAAAVIAARADRTVPALLAGGAALLTLLALRMSADLDPLRLDIDGDRLIVRMRRQSEVVPLRGAVARRLGADEIDHLQGLATVGWVTAGTGGFDSHRLGELDLYASSLDNAVLIDRGESSVVVTPDDPERFLAVVAAAGALRG
jgi:hypothetical protein